MTCYKLQVRENSTASDLNKERKNSFTWQEAQLAKFQGRLTQQLIIQWTTQILFSVWNNTRQHTDFPFGLAPFMVDEMVAAGITPSHSIQTTGQEWRTRLPWRPIKKTGNFSQSPTSDCWPSCTRIVSHTDSWTKYWQKGWTLIHSLNQESPPWAKELPGLPMKERITNYWYIKKNQSLLWKK